MRTEIVKKFRWGFVLGEPELRRVLKRMIEAGAKEQNGVEPTYHARAVLKDGTVIDTQNVDEVFQLENGGMRAIQKVELATAASPPASDWSIGVTFQDGNSNIKSWESVQMEISSASRDWAFVTAADLEDSIRRTKILAWDPLQTSRLATFITLIVGMLLITWISPYLGMSSTTDVQLKERYEAGEFKDAIEALIFIESRKAESLKTVQWFMPLLFAIPFIVGWVFVRCMMFLRPSYNFYWGDYITKYDRQKKFGNAVWTLVVLGIVVSVAANFFSKKLGF
jgi:hypothetical protein